MVTLVVHHRVRDFDAWKPVFDEHEDVRRSHGEIEHRVYRDIHNPNRVIVHNDFPSETEARAFMERAPWLAVFPGLAISLAVLGFNLFGDTLRDAWDPKLRNRA